MKFCFYSKTFTPVVVPSYIDVNFSATAELIRHIIFYHDKHKQRKVLQPFISPKISICAE